jgi:hypothetical protein
MIVLRKDSDEATLLTPWFIGKQDVTTGVAPPRLNGRKSWIYQQKPSKKPPGTIRQNKIQARIWTI